MLLWVGAAAMAVGALAVGLAGRGTTGRARTVAAVAVGPPVSAGTWYVAMALGQATLVRPAGVVAWGRYADGVVTIPLLVALLGLLAGADRRATALAMAVGAYTMATTLAATLSTGAAALVWLAVSVGGFCALLALVFGPLTPDPDASTRRLRGYLVALWLGYPLLWLLGPAGLALAPDVPTGVLAVGLDLLVKPGTGLLAVRAASGP
ncbi:MAG: bacteriorhodopsin [Haloferacaceae archaeon]